jgi:hypothetical protein
MPERVGYVGFVGFFRPILSARARRAYVCAHGARAYTRNRVKQTHKTDKTNNWRNPKPSISAISLPEPSHVESH